MLDFETLLMRNEARLHVHDCPSVNSVTSQWSEYPFENGNVTVDLRRIHFLFFRNLVFKFEVGQ
jgi:hypothetical protein